MPAAPRPSRTDRSRLLAPLGVVALALVVRTIVLAQLGGHPSLQPAGVLDDAVYVELATRVAHGDLALAPGVYFLSPFYTYFLGLVFALSGGSLGAARAVQIVLGAAGVALIMRTAAIWFGRRAGLIAGALAALTGLFAFNEILILQSSIDVFLTSLALFALTRALRSRSALAFLAAGLALGALSLNRPNALACLVAVAAAWVGVRRDGRALREVAALALGAAVLLGPVAVRNRLVAGEAVLISSHGGLNFYIGNSEGADGTWRSVEGIRPWIAGQAQDAERVAASAVGHPVSAGEASSYFYGQACQWIRSNPARWLGLLARKAALLINAGDAALNYSYTYFSRDEISLLSALVVGPWLIIPLGIVGLVVAAPPRERQAYLAWSIFVPAYAASVVAFFVSSRYRLPLLVPLVAGGGAFVSWAWDRRAVLSTGAPVAAAAVAAVLAIVVNWPLQADTGRMNERGERIVRLMSDGRIEEGERLLAATEGQHPERGLLLYRIGVVFRERGDAARAVEYLRRAMAADPREPHIRLNLGEVLYESGRPGEAIEHLEAARSAGLEPATVRLDLAGAYHAVGRDDLARASLASVEITPTMSSAGLLELGRAALDVNDAALAARFLRESAARGPALAAPRFFLAVSLAELGRFAEARQAAEEALRLQPDLAQARALLQRIPADR